MRFAIATIGLRAKCPHSAEICASSPNCASRLLSDAQNFIAIHCDVHNGTADVGRTDALNAFAKILMGIFFIKPSYDFVEFISVSHTHIAQYIIVAIDCLKIIASWYVSKRSRGSHIPGMTPRIAIRIALGVIATLSDPLDTIKIKMSLIAVNIWVAIRNLQVDPNSTSATIYSRFQ